MHTQTVRNGLFRHDAALHAELTALVAPSYVDPSSLLQRELAHCDTLYLGRNGNGELQAFFLTAYEFVPVRDKRIATAYLGLSATRQELKNSGLVRDLYIQFLVDAGERENQSGERIVLWYTTATPSAYQAGHVLFTSIQPESDGSYSPTAAALAQAIAAYKNVAAADHPFVWRGVAINTRYSDEEKRRIEDVVARHHFRLLSALNVDETRGDRLLVLAGVPEQYRHRNADAGSL